MTVEGFSTLKEIDSLTKMRIHQLKAKGEQEARLVKLNEKRQTTISQTDALKEKLVQNHQKLADIEKKIKVSSEQKERLIERGSEEQKITAYSLEIDQLEEQGFALLQEAESIETERGELKTFIKGLDQTIHEIQTEVDEEVSRLNKEIENLELRLKLLQEQLPGDFKSVYQKISAKNLAHGPFTRIDQGSCFFCRFKISRIEESEIDIHKNLKTCPQCSRIFLPYGA